MGGACSGGSILPRQAPPETSPPQVRVGPRSTHQPPVPHVLCEGAQDLRGRAGPGPTLPTSCRGGGVWGRAPQAQGLRVAKPRVRVCVVSEPDMGCPLHAPSTPLPHVHPLCTPSPTPSAPTALLCFPASCPGPQVPTGSPPGKSRCWLGDWSRVSPPERPLWGWLSGLTTPVRPMEATAAGWSQAAQPGRCRVLRKAVLSRSALAALRASSDARGQEGIAHHSSDEELGLVSNTDAQHKQTPQCGGDGRAATVPLSPGFGPWEPGAVTLPASVRNEEARTASPGGAREASHSGYFRTMLSKCGHGARGACPAWRLASDSLLCGGGSGGLRQPVELMASQGARATWQGHAGLPWASLGPVVRCAWQGGGGLAPLFPWGGGT